MKKIWIIIAVLSVVLNILFIRWIVGIYAPYDFFKNYHPTTKVVDTTKDTIHIFFNINDDYAKYLAVTMASILDNTDSPLYFHVFHTGLSPQNMERLQQLKDFRDYDIEFIAFDATKLKDFPESRRADYLKKESLIRLFMPELKPDIDKYIYIDVDTLVIADINGLWQIDLDNEYVGAVRNLPHELFSIPQQKELPYYNAGILLVNAHKWRTDNLLSQFYTTIKKYHDHLPWLDQDVINITLAGNIKELPTRYNSQINMTCFDVKGKSCNRFYSDIAIIHWNGPFKPWLVRPTSFNNLFWIYAYNTPFIDDIKKARLKNIVKTLFSPES